MIDSGIFSNKTNLKDRLITNYGRLEEIVKHLKGIGLKITLTSGTYDMIHIGHAEYLERAKDCGDILVVGVDSDEKVKKRKGPSRPIVPEKERVSMLAHLRHADVIFLKGPNDEKHQLLKTVQPDVLIVSETSGHEDEKLEEMKKFCGEMKVLPPQATTSTSARIRKLHIEGFESFAKKVFDFIQEELHKINGDKGEK